MNRSLVLVTAPAEEPVTFAEAQAHMRIDTSDEEDLIEALIVAAREYVEEYTSRQLVTATWRLSLSRFPLTTGCIEIPRPRLLGITSIAYTDENGDAQTLDPSSYQVDTDALPGRVVLAPSVNWPTVGTDYINPVRITYTAGYGNAAAVPQAIKQAMLLLVAHWHENRESVVVGVSMAEIPQGVKAILSPYRVWGEV